MANLKLLVSIAHPAHVHVFKHLIWNMEKRGFTSINTCLLVLLCKFYSSINNVLDIGEIGMRILAGVNK